MPRPNRARTVAAERTLARRIAHEREARGWSPEGLASRMTRAGCSINLSAIYKIEKADPPRRITVDELVGFAEVFGIPVQDLLLPAEIAARADLLAILTTWDDVRIAALDAQDHEEAAWQALTNYVEKHPEIEPALQSLLGGWATTNYPTGDSQTMNDYFSWRLGLQPEFASDVFPSSRPEGKLTDDQ